MVLLGLGAAVFGAGPLAQGIDPHVVAPLAMLPLSTGLLLGVLTP